MRKGRSPKKLAKFLAYVLGRRPDEFGLVPDDSGFVKIKDLLKAIHEEDGWKFVRKSHINEILLILPAPPIAVADLFIRAVDRRHLPLSKPSLNTPKLLYTCVRKRAYPHLLERGVFPPDSGRVILATTTEMALRIGRRSDIEPVLLTVQTQIAMEGGVLFHTAGDTLFFIGFLPVGCFSGPPLPKEAPAPRKQPARKSEKEEKTPGSFHLKWVPESGRGDKPGQKQRKREIAWKKGRRQLKKNPWSQ